MQEQQIDMHNDPVRYREGDLPETSLVPTVPFALAGTHFQDIKTRKDLVRELTKGIPLNEYGLPKYIYRPDLLDVNLLISSMERGAHTFVDDMIQSSMITVLYTQGFPTLTGENPFWGRLPHENEEAFAAFLQYLEQQGVRTLHSQEMLAFSEDLREEWFHINYWFSRARAYDQFRTAHHRRLREHRIMDLEDNHFVEGEKIFKRIVRAIANKSEADLQELDIDKLIGAMEKVGKLQRLAVGLSTSAGNEEKAKSSSVEVIMRDVAEESAPKVLDEAFDITLLNDPELASKAQELIIRVNK